MTLRSGLLRLAIVTFALHLLALTSPALANTPIPTPMGDLGGEVVNVSSGEPVPGVIVTLLQDGQALERARTDKNGQFAFLDLPVGPYTIAVEDGETLDLFAGPLGYFFTLTTRADPDGA